MLYFYKITSLLARMQEPQVSNPSKHESARLVLVSSTHLCLGNAPTAPSVPRLSLTLPLLRCWTIKVLPLPRPPRLMVCRVWNILSSGWLADRA